LFDGNIDILRVDGDTLTKVANLALPDAVNMAVAQRRPTQVIHDSDQGCQYTSIAFGLRCREAGVRPSMGSVGDAYDNALCESFFASLEGELLDRRRFATQVEARLAIFEYIEGWSTPIVVTPPWTTNPHSAMRRSTDPRLDPRADHRSTELGGSGELHEAEARGLIR
jgi:hypothetical protein